MQRLMFKSKIHRAVVTATDLDYEGSITVDAALLSAAQMIDFEQVHVLNLNNGARIETYILPGREGSGAICLNGAAARCFRAGDRIIIISYGLFAEDELANFTPRVVVVDDRNRPVSIK